LTYLLDRLSAARIAMPESPADAVVAERLVGALATWITSSGAPFPNAPEILVPLLGVGAAGQRGASLRALRALVLRELREPRRTEAPGSPPEVSRSATLNLIVRRLQADEPAEAFLRDAAQILWEADGKLLLSTLLGVLKGHTGALAGTPAYATATVCLEELRARLNVDFPTLEAWLKWWGETKDQPLERILSDCQRRLRESYASNWRQMVRRLRETEDAERLLLAIQETLETVPMLELRVAATVALGDFAEWLGETRVDPKPAADAASDNGQRDKLLARGVQVLLASFERQTFPPERPEVLRAGITALRKYHVLLEKSPPLLSRVSRIVVERLDMLAAQDPARAAEDLQETLRLAGALRVSECESFVLSLVEGDGPETEKGIELLTTAIGVLGRLQERGVQRDAASLLMAQFGKPRAGSDKAVRDLRRACVTALVSGSEDPLVRESLREFHLGLLQGMERDFRIPAVLGLGTLAHQRDAQAFAALVSMLEVPEPFEAQEIIAAIDSIAYVGGQPAMMAFVKALGKLKDKTVEESLWKKVVAALSGPQPVSVVWLLETFERLALAEDSLHYLEQAVKLAADPLVAPMLGQETGDLPAGGQPETAWRATLLLARARDLLGDEAGAAAAVSRLGEMVQKSADLKARQPAAANALLAFRGKMAQRVALEARLAKAEGAEAQQVVQDVVSFLESEPDPFDRWRGLRWLERQVLQNGAPDGAPEGARRLRELLHKVLGAPERTRLWDGFPPGFRERHVERWLGGSERPKG
jgi:hypothetical protein